MSKDNKRTDYPGKEIAELVERRWGKNFVNEIKYVVGDEWHAGNLSYHISTRPIWHETIKGKTHELDPDGGIIYTGNEDILKKGTSKLIEKHLAKQGSKVMTNEATRKIFKEDKEWKEGLAKKQLLSIFNHLGTDDDLSKKGRRALTSLIFF